MDDPIDLIDPTDPTDPSPRLADPVDRYYQHLKNLLETNKDSLLSCSSLTQSNIKDTYAGIGDKSMGLHLSRKFEIECRTSHHTVSQIALLNIGLDSTNARILFPRIMYQYEGTKIMAFFHWIVCSLAPYSLRSYGEKAGLDLVNIDSMINEWKSKDSIAFFYGLTNTLQELILRSYAEYDSHYSDQSIYASDIFIKLSLGM